MRLKLNYGVEVNCSMFDAESANHSLPGSSHGARQHSLLASLKHAFWRAPRWFELLICASMALGFWLDHGFSVGLLTRVGALLFIIRSFSVPFHYCESRWPDDERGIDYGAWGVVGLAIFYLSLPILFRVDWSGIARHGIDWPMVAANALGVAAFGVFMLVLLGPLMWLLDRVFKPLAKSKSQKFVGALGFLTLCGAWWLTVIFGLLASGLGHVMFGGSSS